MSIDFRHSFCHSKRVFVLHRLVVFGEKNVVDDNYDKLFVNEINSGCDVSLNVAPQSNTTLNVPFFGYTTPCWGMYQIFPSSWSNWYSGTFSAYPFSRTSERKWVYSSCNRSFLSSLFLKPLHLCLATLNEWMKHLYSALLCIVHPKRFTIIWGGSLFNHHQCAASTWMMRRQPQHDLSCLAVQHHYFEMVASGYNDLPVVWPSWSLFP